MTSQQMFPEEVMSSQSWGSGADHWTDAQKASVKGRLQEVSDRSGVPVYLHKGTRAEVLLSMCSSQLQRAEMRYLTQGYQGCIMANFMVLSKIHNEILNTVC